MQTPKGPGKRHRKQLWLRQKSSKRKRKKTKPLHYLTKYLIEQSYLCLTVPYNWSSFCIADRIENFIDLTLTFNFHFDWNLKVQRRDIKNQKTKGEKTGLKNKRRSQRRRICTERRKKRTKGARIQHTKKKERDKLGWDDKRESKFKAAV